MNILFFLLPKKDVEFVLDTFSIRQVIEKMEFHHYSAIPVLDKQGKYLNTISCEDLLFAIKDAKLNWEQSMKIPICTIKPHKKIQSITINKEMNDLIEMISNQNFVPVCDDNNFFIGIITRKSVIQYLKRLIKD